MTANRRRLAPSAEPLTGAVPPPATSRRDFVRLAAIGGVALALPGLAACNDAPTNPAASATLDLRTERGVLNALYAMEQLTGDFFTRVTTFRFVGMTGAELTLFNDMLTHDGAHVRYFVDAVRSGRVYDYLGFDFSEVDFTARAAVLDVARTLTDASAAAYAGALPRIRDAGRLGVVAKIASVEARHSAAVRDLIDAQGATPTGTAFAAGEVVSADGLGIAPAPGEALASVRPYFRTDLTIRG